MGATEIGFAKKLKEQCVVSKKRGYIGEMPTFRTIYRVLGGGGGGGGGGGVVSLGVIWTPRFSSNIITYSAGKTKTS